MHYCCLIITKDFPTDDVLEEVLKPFNEDNYNSFPAFTWDWYKVGGRYNGALKLKVNKEDEKYQWKWYANPSRNGRFFRSYLLSRMEMFANGAWLYNEEDYFRSMGFNEGFLYVDGGFIPDILNIDSVECFCCIDKDGNAYARERWTGEKFEEDTEFDDRLKTIIDNSKECFACIVDLHS